MELPFSIMFWIFQGEQSAPDVTSQETQESSPNGLPGPNGDVSELDNCAPAAAVPNKKNKTKKKNKKWDF